MQENVDKKLAKRILDGDQRSFDAFFNTYYPRLFRFALVRLDNDRDLADETAQVVLCQALSKLDTYRGEAPLFSWLCTFCRYEVSRQRKARNRAQGDAPLTEDDPAVRAALDSLLSEVGTDPDVALYQSEIQRLIKVAMDYLPAVYADALEAKYVRDMSVIEIAQLVGKSPKATESVLTRARAAFRDAFQALISEEDQLRDDDRNLASLLEY
jgi:RNA polymerase sigma-70 factor (ECF subfamily)